MGLKMIFYLTNVTNAVNLSQPSVCIGGGLHAPFFRTALSKPRNLSYFPLKIRSRPKKGENRPRLRTERLDSWVSKAARLREDTTQKTTTNFCSQRYQPSRVTTLPKLRHPLIERLKKSLQCQSERQPLHRFRRSQCRNGSVAR